MKQVNRKLVIIFFSVIALVLSACGGKNSEEDSKTIKVWEMGNSDWEKLVEPYEEETGMKIEVQGIPWDNGHDKLLTAVASGEGPDIILMGTTWMQEFVEADAFVDLSEYVDDDEYENLDLNSFIDGATDTSEFDDGVYGIPWHVDTRALFYRTDTLEGIGYDSPPQDWDEMKDASQKLVDRDGGEYAIDLAPEDINEIYFLAFQNGWVYEEDKGAENFKKQEFVDTVDLYKEFYDKEYSQLGKGKELPQAFEDETKPMFFSGPWDIKNIEDNAPDAEGKWDIATMPEGETDLSIIGGSQIAVFEGSEKVEESVDFINWMSDKERQLDWYDIKNELPSLISAWEEPVLADDPLLSVFGEQLQNVEAPPVMENKEEMDQKVMDMIEKVIKDGEDVDKATDELASKAEQIIND